MARPMIRVDGARELRATMKAAGVDLGDLRAVNARTAQKVSAVAAPRVPRLTGRLSGTVRPGGTRTMAVVRAGGAAVPYAGVIEFGWPAHNIEAQPSITTAAADTEPEWLGYYQTEIGRIIDRIRGAS